MANQQGQQGNWWDIPKDSWGNLQARRAKQSHDRSAAEMLAVSRNQNILKELDADVKTAKLQYVPDRPLFEEAQTPEQRAAAVQKAVNQGMDAHVKDGYVVFVKRGGVKHRTKTIRAVDFVAKVIMGYWESTQVFDRIKETKAGNMLGIWRKAKQQALGMRQSKPEKFAAIVQAGRTMFFDIKDTDDVINDQMNEKYAVEVAKLQRKLKEKYQKKMNYKAPAFYKSE